MIKILTIAQKQLYSTFKDRNVVLLMVGLPLVIAVMIGLAFGGNENGINIADLPIVIVNQDAGAEQQGTPINYGDILISILAPAENSGENGSPDGSACPLNAENPAPAENQSSLDELLNAAVLDDPAAARSGVETGDYVAAIIIPAEYSARIVPNIAGPLSGSGATPSVPAVIEIYGSSGSPLQASIVRGIVESLNNSFLTSNIAIGASINTLIQQKPSAAIQLISATDNEDVQAAFACAFLSGLDIVSIEQQSLTAEERRLSLTAELLVFFGSAQAAFMALFTGLFGALEIFEERKAGTLQRMLISPTPRTSILAGKLLGTFVTVFFQLLSVLVALTFIGSLMEGRPVLIWGDNLLAIFIVLASLALAASGMGVLIAGVAKTTEQANAFGPLIVIILSLIGGAFGFTLPETIMQFSLIFQGSDAFSVLSRGESDILTNVIWMVGQGTVFFITGIILFNRRLKAE